MVEEYGLLYRIQAATVLVTVGIMLAACQPDPTPYVFPTREPTITPQPTVTQTPTATPTPTPTATATVTSWPLFTLDILQQPPLLSNTEGCQLPCWQELEPDQTTIEEAQTVLDRIYQHETNASLEPGLPSEEWREGFAHLRYGWEVVVGDEPIYFGLALVFDDRGILQSTSIFQTGGGHYPISTLDDFIQLLGTPEHISVSLESYPMARQIQLRLLYENGIGRTFDYLVEGSEPYPPVCFDKPPRSSTTDLIRAVDLNSPDPPLLQRKLGLQVVDTVHWRPIDKQWSMSIDEFVAIVRSSEPCIDAFNE